jgi:signal transduction histidine kinase
VKSHARVVRTVAEGVALGIVLALFAAAMAARTSLGGALASVRALVRWSDRVVDVDNAPPAPAGDTPEIARLAIAFDGVVRRLVDASTRARATSENIAHELRTPLTTIRAELEALAAVGASDANGASGAKAPVAERAATIERMRGDVDRLARVVDAILILAAPPGGSRATDCVVNLADLARELAPPSTRVEAPDEALVVAEPHLVELAITNLLENARKHTGREARAISVARSGELARVAVIDDGPGVDEAARARMFERYWRASGDGGGTGLGLALVRAVARRHGGEADARANADGPGLEVGLTFGSVVGWHDGQ